MNLNEALAAIAALLESSTGAAVHIARPSETDAGLVIWPWRLQDVTSVRNAPASDRIRDLRAPAQHMVDIYFLLLANNAGPQNAASLLMHAHRTLLENPLIGSSNLQIVSRQLSVEELAAVFTAAQVKLSLCANYSLRLTL